MQTREKILAATLAAVVAVWFLRPALQSLFIEPLSRRNSEIKSLGASVESLEEKEFQLLAATRQLAEWRAESLPPDLYNAEREYPEWLFAAAQLSGWEDIEIVPGGRNTRNASFTGVSTTVSAEARFDEITRFIDLIETTDLLHRVSRLEIECPSPEGDPLMSVTVTLEGLAVTDAAERSRLLPTTLLAERLSERADRVVVESPAGFPEAAPFRIRIDDELLDVVEMDDNGWVVERGAGGTFPTDHRASDPVELLPVRATEDRPQQALAIDRIFVKPRNRYGGEPRFAELPPAIRGQRYSARLEVMNRDPLEGSLRYRVLEGAPDDLEFSPSSGELTWDLEDDAELREYTLKVAAFRTDADEPVLEDTLTLAVRRPNRPPRLSEPDVIDAWLGRSLTFVPVVRDEDLPEEELSFSLEGDVPRDLDFDRRTGEVNWTPELTRDIGQLELELTVTDSGVPPESDTVSLVFNLIDDSATYTYLVGTIVQGGDREAWLYDQSTGNRTLLLEGRGFQVADVSGTVETIRVNSIDVRRDGALYQLAVGDNLRELRPAEAGSADGTSGAPTPSGETAAR